MVSKVRNFWLCVFSGVVATTLILNFTLYLAVGRGKGHKFQPIRSEKRVLSFFFFFFFFFNRQPTQTPLSLLWGTRIAKGGADPNPPRWTWRHPLLCLSVSELDAFTPPGLLRGDATVSTPTLDFQVWAGSHQVKVMQNKKEI